jgi:hypothetical protein
MPRITAALLALVGVLALAPPAAAAPPVSPDPKSLIVPPEELSKARELVQKLGSEAFPDREAAEQDLAAMGRRARAALLDGVNLDPDPEIRQRCHVLLHKANAEEMKARIDTFLADTENKYEHDLPGWHQLRATVRGEWKMFGWTFTARSSVDKAARELFIEFLQAPGGRQLLTAMDGPPANLGQLVATRKQDLYTAKFQRVAGVPPRNPSVIELAVVVFGESQVNSRYVPRAVTFSSVLSTSGLVGAVSGTDDRAAALRAVLAAWFDSRTEMTDLYLAFNLAAQMGQNDAAGRLAVRLLDLPGVPGHYKGQAFTTLVRQKMTDQVPTLEKAFTDTTVLVNTVQIVDGKQVRKTIEVRDAALAAAVLLSGQNPGEYGFDSFPRGMVFTYTLAKIADDKRKDAFEKWAKWRGQNP